MTSAHTLVGMALATAVLLAMAVAVTPYGPFAAGATPPAAAVTIEEFAFVPGDLTIAPGTTVAWVNKDEAPHTIITDDKTVRSGALDTGDAFSHQFTTPGTYSYHCSLHPQMTGHIIVQ